MPEYVYACMCAVRILVILRAVGVGVEVCWPDSWGQNYIPESEAIETGVKSAGGLISEMNAVIMTT